MVYPQLLCDMACQSPIWKLPTGGLREVPVPCGRCPPCMKRRVDSWVFRLLQEDKVSDHSHFITLTYDTAHVPITQNGFMTLDKGEFPRFMKRLRKLCPGVSLKYYACGEYGTKSKRPHYHAIIFNVPDEDFFFQAWHLDGVPIGAVHVGQVSGDSIAYCCKYMNKKEFRSYHQRDDRIGEFSLMSKGLGANYLSPAIRKYHLADLSRNYVTKDGGYKVALPRYYGLKLYDQDWQKEELRMLADEMSVELDNENRKYFEVYYGDALDYSYEKFVEDQRKARIYSFEQSNLKERNGI